MKKILIIHPLLLSTFPILHLFATNLGQVHFVDVFAILTLSLFITLVGWASLQLFIKNGAKTAIIVSVGVIGFFSYGHVYFALKDLTIWGNLNFGKHLVCLFIFGFSFYGLSHLIIRAKSNVEIWTKLLNLASMVLVINCVGLIIAYHIRKNPTIHTSRSQSIAKNFKNLKPDVYFIVLDAYASGSVLQKYFGYNNQYFLNFLKSCGFHVVPKSLSNYMSTRPSLSATLNMAYHLDHKENTLSIKNSNVINQFKTHGYKIINFPSGYGVSMPLNNSDLEFDCGGYGEFTISLMETTLLQPLNSFMNFVDHISAHRQRILCNLNEIPKVHHEFDEPIFVFAHFVSPHPPYVFDRDGRLFRRGLLKKFETEENFMTTNNNWNPDFKEYYINQLHFINEQIMEMVQNILLNSEIPPIIVLQSDHGPAFSFWDEKIQNCRVNLRSSNPQLAKTMIEERSGILNAIYLPQARDKDLKKFTSSVNTFRLIFNSLFESQYPMLEEKVFWYDLTEITQIVRDFGDKK